MPFFAFGSAEVSSFVVLFAGFAGKKYHLDLKCHAAALVLSEAEAGFGKASHTPPRNSYQ